MSTKMGRSPCCDKLGLKKGPWTPEEDQKLLAYIEEHGHGNWRALPTKAGLQRCGKSCRLRWTNYLRPDIKRGKFSLQEEQTIIQLHALLGNRWSAIATHLPKRTDNEIKNYWNTHLKKRLTKMGIDPVTHKPKNDALHSAGDGGQHSKNAANLSHMAQWESARLEAEARLVRQSSKLRLSNNSNNTSSFNNCDPHSELHLNDHHYITMSDSTGTGTSPTPRCLDDFKAWQRGWTSTSTTSTDANNDDIIGISMGSTTGIGGGVGLGIESPTSTLSFSENAPPPVPVVPNMGNGAVIEFMGHHQNHDQDHHHMHNQEMGIKKEGDHHHIQHNNEHEWMSSLSFMPSHHINEQRSHDHDHQDDHDKNHDEGFMDGFTELLLSTNSTTSISDHQSATKTSVIGDNNNNNNNNNSTGTTTTTNSSKGSDYYEDNKTYWNSILNLVNSSPSHSPMF